jgi:hypothetical protein
MRTGWCGEHLYLGGKLVKDRENEFKNLYPSLNIMEMVQYMRMRWAGQVECMGNELVKSDNLEDLPVVANVLN